MVTMLFNSLGLYYYLYSPVLVIFFKKCVSVKSSGKVLLDNHFLRNKNLGSGLMTMQETDH